MTIHRKAATFLMSLIVVPVALPSPARDWDDLSSWSLEKLCDKKDKARHEEAVYAELARRSIFTSSELDLIREGRIPSGTSEAVLHCSWGQPRATETWYGESWQVYYRRRDSQNFFRRTDGLWRLLVRIDTSLVAEIHPDFGDGPPATGRATRAGSVSNEGDDTFSGRRIETGGLSEPSDIRSIFR
jgi:hypothetical protein